jgi:hypothetical protein
MTGCGAMRYDEANQPSTGKDERQDMQELRERLIGLKERIAHVMARL